MQRSEKAKNKYKLYSVTCLPTVQESKAEGKHVSLLYKWFRESYYWIVWKPWISNDKVFLNTFKRGSKIKTFSFFPLLFFLIYVKTIRPLTILTIRADILNNFIFHAFIVRPTFPPEPVACKHVTVKCKYVIGCMKVLNNCCQSQL